MTLLGVRFGLEPTAPTLESTCFLAKESIDFLQIFYPEKRKNQERIKNGPGFDNSFIRYDNLAENENDLIYCCFKQPLRFKVTNSTELLELNELNEVILDKKVYLSLYYLIGDHNNTLKSNQPFNLVEYKEKPIFKPPATTTVSSTTKQSNTESNLETKPSLPSFTTTASSFNPDNSDDSDNSDLITPITTTPTSIYFLLKLLLLFLSFELKLKRD